MLIGKYGNNALTAAKHVHNLLEQLKSRIQLLPHIVGGIIAVLAHKQHSIDGEGVSSEGQGPAHGGKNLETVLGGEASAQIVRRDLIGVHRNDRCARLLSDAIRLVAVEHTADNHCGVRLKPPVVGIHSHHGRNFLFGCGATREGGRNQPSVEMQK